MMLPRPIGLAVMTALMLSVHLTPEPAQQKDQYGILFFTSVDPDQPGIATVIDEARSEIQAGIDRPVHFDVEYLDPYLFSHTGENETRIAAFLQAKYSHQRFDLIVAIGDQPLAFAEKHEPRLFPQASIVSLLIDSALPSPAPVHTGVSVQVLLNFVPTLKTALDQNPDTRQVVLVAGSSRHDRLKVDEAKKELTSNFPDINLVDLTDNSVDELKLKVATLGPESIILFLDLTADKTGEEYISARVLPEIAQAANRPIYGISSEQVGKGVVGGSVIDMREVGQTVGKISLRLLQGEKPESMPVTAAEFQHYVFDASQMGRWGIIELPPNSVVIGQENSPWNRYKWQIFGLGVAVFLEGTLIASLLKSSIQRRGAERKLARMRAVENLEIGLAATLLHLPAMSNAAIDRGFKQFIDFFGIDCISLFEFLEDKGHFRLLHYRCIRGSRLRMARLKQEDFQWASDQLLRGQSVAIRTRAQLHREAPAVMPAFTQAGLHSFAGVPLKAEGRVTGALFFSSSKEREWGASLLAELQRIANIVAISLERAHAQAALEQSEQLKTAVLASLPSFVAVLDLEGNISNVNPTASVCAKSVGFGCGALRPGLNYFDVCREAAANGSKHALLALQGTQEICSNASGQFEMEYPSGNQWFHMTVVPLIGQQPGVVASHTDVTQRKLAELDLKESESRFRLMSDSAPILMWMSGKDKLCSYFNRGWLEFTGNRLEDEIGEGWLRGVHPEDRQHCLEVYTRAFDAREGFTTEYRLRRFDGQYRWVVDRGVPRFRADGAFSGFIGCADDITVQKETEAARAEISGRLIRAQEDERARIARELHDDINQKLGLLAIDIQQLQQQLPQLAGEAQQGLTQLFEKTNRISGDVQRLSHQLHSSRLDYLGLPAALRRLCQEFAEQHHIPTDCVIETVPPNMPREVSLGLFRMAQECLNNTAKHSAAKHAKVELLWDSETLRMNVSDDGVGFDAEKVAMRQEPGLGLISMRERLRLVNGAFSVRSAPGVGTIITAIIPLKSDSSDLGNAKSKAVGVAG
jgi:PAS domain S-box-containing protein